jgi:hypothetical protein
MRLGPAPLCRFARWAFYQLLDTHSQYRPRTNHLLIGRPWPMDCVTAWRAVRRRPRSYLAPPPKRGSVYRAAPWQPRKIKRREPLVVVRTKGSDRRLHTFLLSRRTGRSDREHCAPLHRGRRGHLSAMRIVPRAAHGRPSPPYLPGLTPALRKRRSLR